MKGMGRFLVVVAPILVLVSPALASCGSIWAVLPARRDSKARFEAVFAGLPQTSRTLVLVNGAYGTRMETILAKAQCNYCALTFEELRSTDAARPFKT